MPTKKNILLVFTDQMRYDAIGAHGNPVIKTPVLDELVGNGITFNKAYTPCPVCVPARFAMHTGQMPHRTDVVENHTMPTTHDSFMEVLSNNGYKTYGVGKMHFTFETGLTTKWGFDKRQICDAEDMNKNDFYQNCKENNFGHVIDCKGVRSEMYYIPQTSQLKAELHHTAWTVDKSIEFLEEHPDDNPFFLMTSFEKPHPPFEPPVPWNKLYRGPEMPLPKRPESFEELMTLWNKFQNRYKYRDQGIDDNLIKMIKAYYYAEISFMDYNLGRLFDYMKKNNLLDNTLVVFTADHGEFLGDYNCFGKRSFLDSSAKIPLIMSYPECEKDVVCDKPASLIDIFPTFLDFAGIDSNEDYSGVSLKSLVDGNCERNAIFGQYEKDEYANYMALEDNFKYIYSAPDQKEFLFDLKTDPNETRNKANNPLYYEKTKRMRQLAVDYFRNDGYEAPFDGNTWRKFELKDVPSDPDSYMLFQDPEESLPSSFITEVPELEKYLTDVNQKKDFNFRWYDGRYDEV